MSIALFGATGNIGREIRAEALRRGKKVTAVVHNRPLPEQENLVSVKGDISNPDDVVKIASGHDAVISAYSPGLRSYTAEDAAELIKAAHDALFSGARKAGVKRVIVVGGVGSLEASPGVDVVDSDFYPKEHRAHTLRNREILRSLRRGDYDLDWTYVSPPLDIKAGPRTGKFRVGEDKLLRDDKGESRISEADFAIAILDALEQGKAIRQRFTAAY
jgi:putative NADH-flavin reductase